MTGKAMRRADMVLIGVILGSNLLLLYAWPQYNGWPSILQIVVAMALVTLAAVAIVSSMYQRAVEAARREGEDEARRKT